MCSFSRREGNYSKPLVSVIMATYNEAPQVVKEAINSILYQTYENFELLIYDDSTNQETKSIIDGFCSDPRVKIFRDKERVGFVKSLNLGLKTAQGKYIARMDGDDISLPNRLKMQVVYLEEHEEISILGGQIDIMDVSGKVVSGRKYPLGGVSLLIYSIVRCPIAHPTVMIRREIIDAGFYYDEKLERAEDLDLWLRLMNRSYRFANLCESVLKYRVSGAFKEKRSCKEQKRYMGKVRKKNFNWHRPIFSILSVCFAEFFWVMPTGILKRLYKLENNG